MSRFFVRRGSGSRHESSACSLRSFARSSRRCSRAWNDASSDAAFTLASSAASRQLMERKVGPDGSAAQGFPSVVVVVLLLVVVVVVGTGDVVVLLEVIVVDDEVVTVEVLVLVVDVMEIVLVVVDVVVEVVAIVVEVVDVVVVVVVGIVVVVVVDAWVDVVVLPGTGSVQAENSEVSPSGAVAVAVMTWPAAVGGSENIRPASPDALVMTWMAPRNVPPSPLPLASHEGVAKNSTVNIVVARLLSVPVTCAAVTIDSTG